MPRGKRKNEQRKTGGAERNDCFPGSPAEGAETERKRTAETAKRGGAAPPGSNDGRTAGKRG